MGNAVEAASRACELSKWKDADAMLALAAANAELGDFQTAVRWQAKAIELRKANGLNCEGDSETLKLYESGSPLRDTPRLIDHKPHLI